MCSLKRRQAIGCGASPPHSCRGRNSFAYTAKRCGRGASPQYSQNQTLETCLIAAEAGFVLSVKETVGKKHSSLAPLIYGGKAAFA